jgi:hypothetical protein
MCQCSMHQRLIQKPGVQPGRPKLVEQLWVVGNQQPLRVVTSCDKGHNKQSKHLKIKHVQVSHTYLQSPEVVERPHQSLEMAQLCDHRLRRPLGLYEHTIHQNDANLTYNMAKYRSLTENVAERDPTVSAFNKIAWHTQSQT